MRVDSPIPCRGRGCEGRPCDGQELDGHVVHGDDEGEDELERHGG